jgi:hypothetical protein
VSSPKPAGQTPYRPVACRGARQASASVRVSLTRGRSGSLRRRRLRSSRLRGSVGRRDGTWRTPCGACADSSTCWSAASASAAAGAPEHLLVGDALDFWRVETIEPGRRLRLVAEMRLPGRAWLIFEIEPDGPGSVIRQTALFDPVGLPGLAYWYALYLAIDSSSTACCAGSRKARGGVAKSVLIARSVMS